MSLYFLPLFLKIRYKSVYLAGKWDGSDSNIFELSRDWTKFYLSGISNSASNSWSRREHLGMRVGRKY